MIVSRKNRIHLCLWSIYLYFSIAVFTISYCRVFRTLAIQNQDHSNIFYFVMFIKSYITTHTFCLEILSCHFIFTRHRRSERKIFLPKQQKYISTKYFIMRFLKHLLHFKLWLMLLMLCRHIVEIGIAMRQLFKDACFNPNDFWNGKHYFLNSINLQMQRVINRQCRKILFIW